MKQAGSLQRLELGLRRLCGGRVMKFSTMLLVATVSLLLGCGGISTTFAKWRILRAVEVCAGLENIDYLYYASGGYSVMCLNGQWLRLELE